MKEYEIKEGDIVELDYINEFTKEHINEGKALVMWKGFNHQPLIHKLDAKHTIWSCYEYIARVVGHADIERYMENAISLEQEPCDDCVSRQAVLEGVDTYIHKAQSTGTKDDFYSFAELVVKALPPVTPQPKTAHWITLKDEYGDVVEAVCSSCDKNGNHKWSLCPNCGAKMVEPQESESE